VLLLLLFTSPVLSCPVKASAAALTH
jgi:hypothetical protein